MPTLQISKLVILISGSGSNLQSFIDQCQSRKLNAEVACVISNKPDAYGLERAKLAGIPTQTLDHKCFATREDFDQALIKLIAPFNPDLIILAGFMRILTPELVNRFCGKLVNIHPSLLPKYPGLNTHQRAIEAKESKAGATVHFVTEELDGGPPILQANVDITESDTAQLLAEKVLSVEHVIYPLAVKWVLSKAIELKKGKVYFHNNLIEKTGIAFDDSLPI